MEKYPNSFHAKTRKDWRKWFQKNHETTEPVWLIVYNKKSNTPSVNMDEAVEEALCFGWIDSKSVGRDEDSRYQCFTKRKPGSNWSAVNKARLEKLIAAGLMTEAGLETIRIAKENGQWDAADAIESLVIPDDLQAALNKNKKAKEYFDAFPRSAKKVILWWVHNAKRPETRQKRIEETVAKASQNIRANQ